MPKTGMLIRTTLALAAVAAVAVTATGVASARQANNSLSGAGSTFVSPLVTAWISPVASQIGINMSYNAIGSGGGIAQIQARAVDFGASDAPLTSDQFAGCVVGGSGCIQIPWAEAGTAPLYRLDGSGLPKHLNITGATLANIYLGKITYWDDKAIKASNKTAHLPHTPITVVHRSDGSGTTYNWTDYLSRVSPTWKSKVGTGTAVSWPVGVGASHSSGVSAAVKATNGAIGYADVEFAVKNHLSFMAVKNRSNRYVTPSLAAFQAAAALDTHPAKDGSLSIVNPPASKAYARAYPICTYTYVIVPLKTANAAALKKLIGWAITKGQSYGPALLFAPIVKSIVTFDQAQLKKIHT